jgi:hypothetical protein
MISPGSVMTRTWRARSASDKTDDWFHWYVTDDTPKDHNKTPEAWKQATGTNWPPILPFLPREVAEALAKHLNAAANRIPDQTGGTQ